MCWKYLFNCIILLKMFPSYKFIIFAAICASISAEKQGKISNGDEADIIEFPYLVSFQSANVQMCSGSILNENWILSTARCFFNKQLDDYSIEFGLTVVNLGGGKSENRRFIKSVIIHEEFDEEVLNDIGLVIPDHPIRNNYYGSFARLPMFGSSKNLHGRPASMAGWGYINRNQRTNRLHKSHQKILSMDECVIANGEGRSPNANNICSMGNESVFCIGDLGSPLVFNGLVVGLASFSNSPHCESVDGKFPNVFTDVSKYVSESSKIVFKVY